MIPINPILAAHVAELDASSYSIFDGLDDPRLRVEAAKLLDFLRGEQVAVPPGVPPEAIPGLRAAAEAAHPDRRCLKLLAARFPAWMAKVNDAARPVWLEGLAGLGPALADLGDDGMGQVITAVNRDPRTLACIQAYALTTKEIVRAIAALSEDAPVEWLQRLVAAVPIAKMEDSKDAERLVPALVPVREALPALVTLAEQSISAAYGTAKALPGAIKKVENRQEYLEDFALLANTVGLSSSGFVLDTLPGLCRSAGVAPARRLVALAAECARIYGASAGQAFLERKTPAAQSALRSA
ncbi:MAG: hypothetical protein FJW31_08720 [Acidobacteria bacterium]|nr:hypothetical protein [Acidobacteriota bacterium]